MMWKTLALAVLLLAPAVAAAGESEHDRARRAVEEGRILPLRDILSRAEAQVPGQLIEAELEDEDGRLVYEIKMLAKDGRLVKMIFDAASGEVLKTKARDRK